MAHHCAVSELIVRMAHDEDAETVARLSLVWYEEGRDNRASPDPLYEQRFRSWYADERDRRLTWLAELDGRPVGFTDLAISVRRPRPGQAAVRSGYLDSAFVLHAYRNQGIGRRLLDALLDDASRNHITAIMLHPTADAIRFYQRAGFDIVPTDTKTRMLKTTHHRSR